MSNAFLISLSVETKCSFSQVALSAEANGLPNTCAVDAANLILKISVPSVSGISTTPYKSSVLAGEPCD